MFTGIILERGRVVEAPQPQPGGGARLVLGASPGLASGLTLGSSLAVDGVCLTITEKPGPAADDPARERLVVELAPETLARSRLGGLQAGDRVNLEPAMKAGDALGGHWVQGHVDGTLEVVGRRDLGENRELAFSLPAEYEPYVVQKGSVTLDGVSLTVSARQPGRFEVALIPHTLEVTTLGDLQPGDRVHLEVDILAKYVEQVLATRGLVEPRA